MIQFNEVWDAEWKYTTIQTVENKINFIKQLMCKLPAKMDDFVLFYHEEQSIEE